MSTNDLCECARNVCVGGAGAAKAIELDHVRGSLQGDAGLTRRAANTTDSYGGSCAAFQHVIADCGETFFTFECPSDNLSDDPLKSVNEDKVSLKVVVLGDD